MAAAVVQGVLRSCSRQAIRESCLLPPAGWCLCAWAARSALPQRWQSACRVWARSHAATGALHRPWTCPLTIWTPSWAAGGWSCCSCHQRHPPRTGWNERPCIIQRHMYRLLDASRVLLQSACQSCTDGPEVMPSHKRTACMSACISSTGMPPPLTHTHTRKSGVALRACRVCAVQELEAPAGPFGRRAIHSPAARHAGAGAAAQAGRWQQRGISAGAAHAPHAVSRLPSLVLAPFGDYAGQVQRHRQQDARSARWHRQVMGCPALLHTIQMRTCHPSPALPCRRRRRCCALTTLWRRRRTSWRCTARSRATARTWACR